MTAAMLTLVVAIALSLVGRDAWGWLPSISRGVIRLGIRVLPADRREIRREEWLAELSSVYGERRVSGLLWTLMLVPVCLRERATAPHWGMAGRGEPDHDVAALASG